MKNKRPVAPGFINALDEYLLLNKPDTWSARSHLVLYYVFLFSVLLTALCFLAPDDPRNSSPVFVWCLLTAILAGIGFIVWLIYLLRFNVFKRFGIVARGDRLLTFILFFINIGLLIATIYIPPIVESIKANRAYNDNEIVQDANNMNLAICRLNYDSIPQSLDSELFLIRNSVKNAAAEENDKGEYFIQQAEGAYQLIDTAQLNSRKMAADSVRAINDSMVVLYRCPDYTFVATHGCEQYANLRALQSFDIYKKITRQPMGAERAVLRAQLFALLHKYNKYSKNYEYFDENYADRRTSNYQSKINTKYELYDVNTGIDNITDRMHRWKGDHIESLVRVFWYSVLVFTLLVFIFRHSTVKTFFLSMLTAVILTIITSLFIAFLRSGESAVLISCIIFYFLFSIVAFTVFINKTRLVVTGIAINLMVFFTVFLPLVIAALYYQLERDKAIYSGEYYPFENETRHYLYAEIAGAVLLLVLIETIFKKIYRKWYALPEN